MKKLFVLAAALSALFAFVSCSKKVEAGEFTIEKGVLKIGMEIGYPPMEYYDADGKTPVGFDIELGKAWKQASTTALCLPLQLPLSVWNQWNSLFLM